MTATKPYRAYCPVSGDASCFQPDTDMRMMTDLHNLQLPLLCQLSKSAPNILWSLGSSVHNQFLQFGRGNPAVMVARVSLKSLLEWQAGKMPGAVKIARDASQTRVLSGL